MIASGIQQLGWTKPSAGPENTAPQQTVAPKASTAPSLDPAQVQQMVQSLAALRESVQQLAAGQGSLAALAQTVDRLAAAQDQMARAIDRLQAADQEILVKIPEFLRRHPLLLPPRQRGDLLPEGPAFGKYAKYSPNICEPPANSGLFAMNREISVCARLRGGAERTKPPTKRL